ncbi:MAG TPA: MlaE family lipid ABC transporter permease subunit, partial [Burkholderiales bacterium]|nr:MlaE family lipid ABC transporter permease subunit [Burkholderiales bacterium]
MLTEQAADVSRGSAAGEMSCTGSWTVGGLASLEPRVEAFAWPAEGELAIDGSAITAMDTSGAWLLHRTRSTLELGGRSVRLHGLRAEFDALLKLIAARAAGAQVPSPPAPSALAKLGETAWIGLLRLWGMLSFLGEAAVAALRSIAQPRRIRWQPILHNLQTGGFEALPITGLLSFLLGIVIAYQGAEQLRRFGANIYIADLVGLSMLRELSPLVTAIIVAGRSGSAYTAQIGTMKVTEEIDALRTVGVPPLDQLVLPKAIALIIALPLLTVYTDVTGVIGGMIMAKAQLGVSFAAFVDRLGEAVSLTSFLIGVGKAPVFAAIIALVGCYQGFQVNSSAESVG